MRVLIAAIALAFTATVPAQTLTDPNEVVEKSHR